MNQMTSQSVVRDNDADLDWLSFRYLIGELSDHNVLAFEERLAVDQTAREALATAVELSQAIMVAGEESVSPTRRAHRVRLPGRESFWLKPVGALAATAAAAFVIAAMLQLLWPASRQSDSAFDTSLLAEWTQMRDAAPDDWSEAALRVDALANGWDGLAATTVPEDISESNWLLTALAPDPVLPGESGVHQQ
jgi:hypothetical protein